ncbi:hypothetical protein IWX63_001403 [Arthrobacter sp. CAN_A2]
MPVDGSAPDTTSGSDALRVVESMSWNAAVPVLETWGALILRRAGCPQVGQVSSAGAAPMPRMISYTLHRGQWYS